MKKIAVIATTLILAACGGESESGSTANTGEQSSLVANTNPQEGVSQYEEVVSDIQNPKNATTIKYLETDHDFGEVMYPSENMYTFKFVNTGSEPLIIESATASCGCTIPNKPEKPIMPGETGELDVIFRPKEGQMGQLVTKKVTVTANTEPKQTYLQIQGTVLAAMLSD